MKAAILEKINSPLIIDDIEIPKLEIGQVLVKVYSSGICGSQLQEITGEKGPDLYLPHLLGHEGAGIIEEIGQGITQVKIGDHVVLHWRKGKGLESDYPKYKWGDRIVGGGAVTTFNEYAVVSENRLTSIDNDIPFDIAALFGCSITTGMGIIENDAQLKMGQSIAVIGCGGVGLNVIQGAKLIGIDKIAAIDVNPRKLEMAKSFGARLLLDINSDPRRISILKGFDVIVDTTGQPELIAKAYELMAPGGKMIMAGIPRFDQSLTLPNISKAFTGKQLIASQGGQCNPNEDIPRYLRLYREGKLKLDDLITHRFPLEKINEALDVVRRSEAGRCIISFK